MAPDITTTTKSVGIHQSDLILRTALMEGLRDLRRSPYLLDYCFASLAQDALTKDQYGRAQIDQAKNWFQKTSIEVFHDVRLGKIDFPCISISLLASAEDETTLSDVDPEVEEDADQQWPVLYGPFTPTNVDLDTGEVTLPSKSSILLAAGMQLVTRGGQAHNITDITNTGVIIAPNTILDLTDATIRGSRPAQRLTLEGSWFKEAYRLGVHVQGEAVYLVYLDSIVRFVLLRYRQRLLEARGFERSTIAATDMIKNEQLENENTYSRYIDVTGFVRQFWPKDLVDKFVSVGTILQVQDGNHVPVSDIPVDSVVTDLNWVGDLDDIDSLG